VGTPYLLLEGDIMRVYAHRTVRLEDGRTFVRLPVFPAHTHIDTASSFLRLTSKLDGTVVIEALRVVETHIDHPDMMMWLEGTTRDLSDPWQRVLAIFDRHTPKRSRGMMWLTENEDARGEAAVLLDIYAREVFRRACEMVMRDPAASLGVEVAAMSEEISVLRAMVDVISDTASVWVSSSQLRR